jgi:hypothetical protein
VALTAPCSTATQWQALPAAPMRGGGCGYLPWPRSGERVLLPQCTVAGAVPCLGSVDELLSFRWPLSLPWLHLSSCANEVLHSRGRCPDKHLQSRLPPSIGGRDSRGRRTAMRMTRGVHSEVREYGSSFYKSHSCSHPTTAFPKATAHNSFFKSHSSTKQNLSFFVDLYSLPLIMHWL